MLSWLPSLLGVLEPQSPVVADDDHEPSTCWGHSSISQLPNELLLEIFAHCVPRIEYDAKGALVSPQRPNSEYRWHTGMPDENLPPWTLMRVCRRWYTLAMSSPSLWSNLIYNSDFFEPAEMRLAITQLGRSGDHPLSLHLPPSMVEAQELTDALAQQCHRWKYAFLPLSSSLDTTTHSYSSFPLLESVTFFGFFYPSKFPPLEKKYFPRLRSIIASFALPLPPPTVESSLASQLTHLGLRNCSYNEIRPLLDSCAPFIQSLDLRVVRYREAQAISGTTVFPQLRRLVLYEVDPSVGYSLECPKLEELVAEDMELDFERFTLAPAITYAKLRLYDTRHAFDFLKQASKLTTLELRIDDSRRRASRRPYDIDELFMLLSTQPVCPQLESLSVHLSRHPRGIHHLIGFIQLARSRTTKLRHAFFFSHLHNRGWWDKPYTTRSSLYTDNVLDGLKDQVLQLRQEHPTLDLHVEFKVDIQNDDCELYYTRFEEW